MATKRSTRLAGFAAAAVVAVMATLMPMVPAFAQHGGSASVNVPNVLAGQTGQEFQITVNHNAAPSGSIIDPAPATPAINWVTIDTPLTGYRITSVIAPSSSWQSVVNATGRSVTLSGGSIAPSGNAVFKVIADVPAAAQDRSGNWKVQVSSDGGQTGGTPLSGTLQTVIRVLKVASLNILGPSGVLDGSATGGQSGIDLRAVVQNFGTQQLDANVALTDSASKLQENSQTPADPVSIPAGGSRAVDFNVTTGSVSSVTTTQAKVEASTATSNSGPYFAQQALVIEPAVALAYITDSLSPKAVRPLQSGVQFTLRVNKSGVPKFCFDKANTTLSFAGVELDLASPDCIERNPQSNQLLTFQAASIPNLPNGSFDATLDVVGSDDNGAPVSIQDINVGKIRVDIDPATISALDSIPPVSRVAGQPDATTDGATLGLSGQVDDVSPVTGQLQGCGPADGCSIDDAWLTVYATPECDGAPIGTLNVKSRLSLGATGAVSGNYNGSYPAGAQCLQFTLRVVDGVGFPTETTEPGKTEIDLIAPVIARAEASKRTTVANPVPGQPERVVQNTLTVHFSECVGGTSTPRDWTVDDNLVTAVGPMTCTGPGGTASQDLTLANELPDDFADFSITYTVAPVGGGTRYFDRVDLKVGNQTLDVLDRLAPLLPNVTQVNGMAQQDNEFWTNTQTGTVVKIAGERSVEAGYTGQIFEETNGVDGLQRSGANADNKVAEKQVLTSNCSSNEAGTDTSVNCSLDLTTNLNGGLTAGNASVEKLTKKIYVLTLDTAPASSGGPNASPLALPPLSMDIKAPGIASVVAGAGKIVVTFSEPLPRGRDFISDWTEIWDTDGNRITLGSVALGADNKIRELNVNDPSYDPTKIGLVMYRFSFGTASDRYEDRATNDKPDEVFCLADVPDDNRC